MAHAKKKGLSDKVSDFAGKVILSLLMVIGGYYCLWLAYENIGWQPAGHVRNHVASAVDWTVSSAIVLVPAVVGVCLMVGAIRQWRPNFCRKTVEKHETPSHH